MEKQEIIKRFLSNGWALDQDALNFLSENQDLVDAAHNFFSSHQPNHIITIDEIKNIFGNVRVLKTFDKKFSKLAPSDVTKILHERYEKLREMLSQQLPQENIISINKISPKTKTFTLIVMVRENEGNRLVVEDPTGEAIVAIQPEKSKFIVSDEVLALVCEQEQGLIAKQLIWPDIPLDRTIAKAEEDIICIFTKTTDYKKLQTILNDKTYVLVFGETDSTNDRIFSISSKGSNKIPDPSLLSINGVKILISSTVSKYSKLWNVNEEVAYQNLLKKRHLDPNADFLKLMNDDNILDEIPDIAVCPASNQPTTVSYKGTTIITVDPTLTAVNLKTRETFKIDIA